MTEQKKDKKLKILLINRWVGYNEGGNETHMKDLIHWLSKRGHKVSVITTKGDTLEEFEDVKKYYLKLPKGYYSYGFFGIFYAILFLIKAFIKYTQIHLDKERFDLISVHFSLEAFLARFIKLIYGIPYVMVLAGDTPLELIEGKRANGAVQISNFMNDQCLKYGYSAEIIPKGFDLSFFRPDLDVKALRKKLNLRLDDKLLLCVCRLDPRKNLITLVEAMNILVNTEKINNIRLLIVGDGVERKFLESKVGMYKLSNHIKFLGQIPNRDSLLPKLYVLADLFVLPTLYEGFGWVYLESMACGTPVLTTNVGSNSEVVGENGILIEPKDPKLLAEKIMQVLSNEDLMKELTERGLLKAKKLSWENIIEKYEAHYMKASRKNCRNIICRISVFFYLFMDGFRILTNLFRGVVFNREFKNKSYWRTGGQRGNR